MFGMISIGFILLEEEEKRTHKVRELLGDTERTLGPDWQRLLAMTMDYQLKKRHPTAETLSRSATPKVVHYDSSNLKQANVTFSPPSSAHSHLNANGACQQSYTLTAVNNIVHQVRFLNTVNITFHLCPCLGLGAAKLVSIQIALANKMIPCSNLSTVPPGMRPRVAAEHLAQGGMTADSTTVLSSECTDFSPHSTHRHLIQDQCSEI
ncbi:hypothetical protein Baya_7027 [Bagarius yarrelli]|uniref:Uncharacterized protein n=1 Tax=Bagarius yarrelli TaxID=175774 RepID=A0A556TZ26_BAGYA|nr:hypothetical protein Baya_7027 [Bagarius yarrelli]